MAKSDGSKLKEKIIQEMTVDYSNALEKHFDSAKQFIRITQEGAIDIQLKERFNGKDQIVLYLIGKLYAKEAGFATEDHVGNKELMNELGIPQGSLLPWLKDLRDKKTIVQVKKGNTVSHRIKVYLIERKLREIEKKLKKSS